MNIATDKLESMSIETPAANITVSYDRENHLIVLDLSQLPAIKVDVIAHLDSPNLDFVYKDFDGARSLLVNILSKHLQGLAISDIYVRSDYEVVIAVDVARCHYLTLLERRIVDFLKEEAGITWFWQPS